MKKIETVDLKRAARKAGGDRYESAGGEFIIYIPQYISRPDGEALGTIKITFED